MPQTGTDKYHVKLSYEVDGLVEKADIIGAIFGQTEGLLGPEMNLNELQRASKVGRIEVTSNATSNATSGSVVIPMSTDSDTCTLIGASIESIDKVGAFDCKFHVTSIDDVRIAKKDDIVKRARELKQKFETKYKSQGETMLKDVHEGNSNKVMTYGPSALPCGPEISESSWIILVEGRGDIINLMRAGYNNALSIEGAKIDESIKKICEEKDTVVAFLDGDRTGGSILKELKSLVKIDIELQADMGIEVEGLTPERVDELLSPIAEQIKTKYTAQASLTDQDKPVLEIASKIYPTLNETLEAVALDDDGKEMFKVPISELVSKLESQSGIKYLMLDGIITQRLLGSAKTAGVQYLIGHRVANITNSNDIYVKTFSQLGII